MLCVTVQVLPQYIDLPFWRIRDMYKSIRLMAGASKWSISLINSYVALLLKLISNLTEVKLFQIEDNASLKCRLLHFQFRPKSLTCSQFSHAECIVWDTTIQ